MRRSGFVVLAAIILVLTACNGDSTESEPAPGPTAPPVTKLQTKGALAEDVQRRLEDAVTSTMNAAGIPGAYVGVFTPGAGDWQAVGGLADLETGEELNFGLNWPVRSVTKSFVVTAMLQLVDEGKVALDDPIAKYVDGVPNGEQVTLRRLANMSAGLPNYTESEAFVTSFLDDPTQTFTTAELNAFAFENEPLFEPGLEQWYSNTDTNLLGQMIEDVEGQDLGKVLKERIFDPLGLKDTSYMPSEVPEPHAIGYQPEDGAYTSVPNNLSLFGPAGAMVTTTKDLRTWAEAASGGNLLTPATQAARLDTGPLVEGPVYDGYGMGIGTRHGFWGHTGQGLGFTALAMHNPDTGATIVIAANASDTTPQPMDGLFAAVAPIVSKL